MTRRNRAPGWHPRQSRQPQRPDGAIPLPAHRSGYITKQENTSVTVNCSENVPCCLGCTHILSSPPPFISHSTRPGCVPCRRRPPLGPAPTGGCLRHCCDLAGEPHSSLQTIARLPQAAPVLKQHICITLPEAVYISPEFPMINPYQERPWQVYGDFVHSY